MFSRSVLTVALVDFSTEEENNVCVKIVCLQTSYFFAQQRANVCFADGNPSFFFAVFVAVDDALRLFTWRWGTQGR